MNAINHVALWAAGIAQFILGAGYMIVGMAVMGAIVGHWRKRA